LRLLKIRGTAPTVVGDPAPAGVRDYSLPRCMPPTP
jgi:hypothetical protein